LCYRALKYMTKSNFSKATTVANFCSDRQLLYIGRRLRIGLNNFTPTAGNFKAGRSNFTAAADNYAITKNKLHFNRWHRHPQWACRK
jgi:hypothetical protein